MRKRGFIATALLTVILSTNIINSALADEVLPQAQAHFKQGVKYSISGNINAALNEYLKAIQIDPNYACAYNNLGYAYRLKGKIDLAIENYNKVLELKPTDDTAHTNLASCYDSRGDYDRAIEEYHKALELDPGSITVELALEKIYKKKAQAEGKTITEVEAEVAALYPSIEKEPSYNKYIDLLNETAENIEETEVINTTTSTITDNETVTSFETTEVQENYSTSDMNETSENATEIDVKSTSTTVITDYEVVTPFEPSENTSSNVEEIDNISKTQEANTRETIIEEYLEVKTEPNECSKVKDSENKSESINGENKVYEMLSAPEVGSLMVLHKK